MDNKSSGVYVCRSKNRFTLSWEIAITSARRQQLGDPGSLNRKATYIDNVQWAVEGRLMALIMRVLFLDQCLKQSAYFTIPVNA